MIESSFLRRIADKVERTCTSRGTGYLLAPHTPPSAVVQDPPGAARSCTALDAGSRRLDASPMAFARYSRDVTSTANGLASIVGTVDRISARTDAPSSGFRIPMTKPDAGPRQGMGAPLLRAPTSLPLRLREYRSEVPSSDRQAAPRHMDCYPPKEPTGCALLRSSKQ